MYQLRRNWANVKFALQAAAIGTCKAASLFTAPGYLCATAQATPAPQSCATIAACDFPKCLMRPMTS